MSEQKPIGAFVPFPVTDELAELMYKAYCAAYASSDQITRGTATEAAILIASAPVQELTLKPAGWCHPQQLAGLRTDTDTPEKERFCVLSLVKIGSRDVPLVRQLEAQALLAARDAEIALLRQENDRLTHKLKPQFFCSDILEEGSTDTREGLVEEARGCDDDLQAFDTFKMEGYAKTHTSYGFFDKDSKCHWFDTEQEALDAAKALKGGA